MDQSAPATGQPTSRRILVVDDEVTIAESVAARLRAEGFTVEVAHDGPGALAAVEASQPDLVVLDVMLPGFDGLEDSRALGSIPRRETPSRTSTPTGAELLVDHVDVPETASTGPVVAPWGAAPQGTWPAPTGAPRPISTAWQEAHAAAVGAASPMPPIIGTKTHA